MLELFQGKRIVVTGAAGTVGSALVSRLLNSRARELRALDNNEGNLFTLGRRFESDARFRPFLCDIRNERKLPDLLADVDYVFHVGGLKHVAFSESNPFETVQTNIVGVQSVIEAARHSGVERVLFTSSDKAVNPTSVMGTSKFMGERLMTAANALGHTSGTLFGSVRFGNVAGSQGSVIPIFADQISSGGPVTLTSPEMSRFMLSLGQAVNLVIDAIGRLHGGEVFVTKMPVMRIVDLAEVMIELLAPALGHDPESVEIVETGPQPGEKMFEELLSGEEVRHTFDIGEMLVVVPPFADIYGNVIEDHGDSAIKPVTQAYVSSNEPTMSRQQIADFLLYPDVLPEHAHRALMMHDPELDKPGNSRATG